MQYVLVVSDIHHDKEPKLWGPYEEFEDAHTEAYNALQNVGISVAIRTLMKRN